MAPTFTSLAEAIAEQPNLPVWLTHIWQRQRGKKLGLILGAGVSLDAGCPSWETLVKRLIRKAKGMAKTMKAHKKAGLQTTYITQILYSLHQEKMRKSSSPVPRQFEPFQIDSVWMEIIHGALYKDLAKDTYSDILARHPYLEALGQLVYQTGFTVNFNFDDLVDEAAIEFSKSRGDEHPEIIWRPKVETRAAPVIYHINGSLPREPRRRRSASLVFTEDAFAEVLISPTSHEAEFIMSRFATTTFLLLGTSLNDNSLKNMLRGGMKRSAANHHFIVYWENPSKRRSAAEQKHIFDVNLEVYNVISIFLTTPQIAELIRLLNQPDEPSFEGALGSISTIQTRRRYYLVGSVVAGKSSCLEALRCFRTFEEWYGRPPVKMYQDHKTLTPDERKEIDDWVYQQLNQKNDRMRRVGVGIHVMDRGFLDLFAFSDSNAENLTKIDQLRDRVGNMSGPLERGQIIFVFAKEDVLSERQARRGKLRGARGRKRIEYDGKSLEAQSETLKKIYRPFDASVFDTSNEPCDKTSRRIARQLLIGPYEPFDFESRMDEIKANGGAP